MTGVPELASKWHRHPGWAFKCISLLPSAAQAKEDLQKSKEYSRSMLQSVLQGKKTHFATETEKRYYYKKPPTNQSTNRKQRIMDPFYLQA